MLLAGEQLLSLSTDQIVRFLVLNPSNCIDAFNCVPVPSRNGCLKNRWRRDHSPPDSAGLATVIRVGHLAVKAYWRAVWRPRCE